MEVAKSATIRFASRIPAGAALGLTVFDGRGIRTLIPLSDVNLSSVEKTVNSIQPGGTTPLSDSIKLAYASLTESGRRQLGYGEYHLVVVTDGEATGTDPGYAVNTILRESPVIIHTVGFCIDSKHSLNQPGRTIYKNADSPESLDKALADVLAESPTFEVWKK